MSAPTSPNSNQTTTATSSLSATDGQVISTFGSTFGSTVISHVGVGVPLNSRINFQIDGPMALVSSVFQALIRAGCNAYIATHRDDFEHKKIVEALKDDLRAINEKLDLLIDVFLENAVRHLRSAKNHFQEGLHDEGRKSCDIAINELADVIEKQEKNSTNLVKATYINLIARYMKLVVYPVEYTSEVLEKGINAFAVEARDLLLELHSSPLSVSAVKVHLHRSGFSIPDEERQELLVAISRLDRQVEVAVQYAPEVMGKVKSAMLIQDEKEMVDGRFLSVYFAKTVFKLKGHEGPVICVSSISNDRVVSGSGDKTLRIWNVSTGECVGVLEGHKYAVTGVSSLSDDLIVSGSLDTTLRIWKVSTEECVGVLKGHEDYVHCIASLSDDIIVSGSLDTTLRIWKVSTGECLGVLTGHEGAVFCVASLSEDRIVSGSDDKTLRIWKVSTGECLGVLTGHEGDVFCVAFLSEDRIVSGSDDKTLRIWKVSTGECLGVLTGHEGAIKCVSSLSEDRIVSGSDDKTLRIWKVSTRECLGVLEGHETWVNCVASLSGDRIVSGSYDKTLRVWDV